MSGEQALERSVLERKEREELHTIAEALGVKPPSRAKKADLIGQILVAAGIEEAPPQEEKPKRTRARKSATKAAEPEAASEGNGKATSTDSADAEPTPADAAESDAGDTGAASARGEGAGPSQETPASATSEARTDSGEGDQADKGAGQPDKPAEAAKADADAGAKAESGAKADAGGQQGAERKPETAGKEQGRDGRDQSGQRDQGQRDQGQRDQGGRGQNRGQGQQQQQQQQRQGQPQPGNSADSEGAGGRRRRRRGRDRDRDRDFRVQEQGSDQAYQGELLPVAGILDLADQGYGFVRTKSYLPAATDAYVSTSQVRRMGLRGGDHVEGAARPALGNEKYGALLRIDKVHGQTPEEVRQRPRFEDLTPLFPDMKLKMELLGSPHNIVGRIVDLICPIGKGQRGMIVSPPKAGKTTVLKQIATAIEANNPEVHLMVLLVDERPEEVTDMRRHVKGEVVSSTFDRPASEHTEVAELALDRAKRLVEIGKDVVIIMDGITRLARAYNLSAPASGRLTSGGIDQAAIYPPKKFFGAARNVEEGGSLTILATALVETGSRADEVIFEEFKGTGNMELRLDRRLAERRIYPAIDVNASSTRNEDLLFEGRQQLELVWRLRRALNGLVDEGGTSHKALELLIEKLRNTRTNEEFLADVSRGFQSTP